MSSNRKTDPRRDQIWNPEDVPPDITPLERARIAASNIRIWADWLLIQKGPAPEKSDNLMDASESD